MGLSAPENANYVVGRGALYFAPFKTGTKTPDAFRDFINVTELSMTFEPDNLDHESSRGGVKETDASVALKVTRSIKITTDHISNETLAAFLLGEASKLTVTAATGLTETLTGVKLNHGYQLGIDDDNPFGVRGITNAVLTNVAGTTTYDEGTDYQIDLIQGFLMPLSTGTIADLSDVKVTFDVRASTRTITVSGSTQVEGVLKYVPENLSGEDKDIWIPHVKFAPDGDYALISDEWSSIGLGGSIMKLSSKAAVYINGAPAFA